MIIGISLTLGPRAFCTLPLSDPLRSIPTPKKSDVCQGCQDGPEHARGSHDCFVLSDKIDREFPLPPWSHWDQWPPACPLLFGSGLVSRVGGRNGRKRHDTSYRRNHQVPKGWFSRHVSLEAVGTPVVSSLSGNSGNSGKLNVVILEGTSANRIRPSQRFPTSVASH
jgi:hypothetical protein